MRAALLLVLLAGCGGSRAMVGAPGTNASYPIELFAHEGTLIVRVQQPGGSNVVVYGPTVERGQVVVEAGLWSGGNRGEQVQCFDVAQLAPPTDWIDRVVWRDHEGGLTPVHVARGDAALTARCAR